MCPWRTKAIIRLEWTCAVLSTRPVRRIWTGYRLAHPLEIFDGQGFRPLMAAREDQFAAPDSFHGRHLWLADVKSLTIVTRSSHLDSREYPRINIYEPSRASVPSDSRCRSCEGFGLWIFRRPRTNRIVPLTLAHFAISYGTNCH
jgi:hypothetical protein